MAPKHSPSFVGEMKTLLEQERDRLISEIGQTKPFPDYGRNDEDNATEIADFTAARSTADALQRRLDEVIAALQRISEGTYGVTDDGRIITEGRLRANPAARSLVE